MAISSATFFAITAALAAGAGGGYLVSQNHVFEPRVDILHEGAPIVVQMPAASASVAPRPAAPPCDDTVGTPAACPGPGYSAEEGGCGILTMKRCNEFKQAFKPKVAERAVECVNALKPNERCDVTRLNLCGHLALVNACAPPDDVVTDVAAPPGSVTASCQEMIRGCGGASLGPTMTDCRQTVAGMNDVGRAAMSSCMKSHCTDKGLLGCEGVAADAK